MIWRKILFSDSIVYLSVLKEFNEGNNLIEHSKNKYFLCTVFSSINPVFRVIPLSSSTIKRSSKCDLKESNYYSTEAAKQLLKGK